MTRIPGTSSRSELAILPEARALLERGESRAAIDLLKQGQRQHPGLDVSVLLGCAYSVRARQLRTLGAERDAVEMGRKSAALLASRRGSMSDTQLADCFRFCDFAFCLELYRERAQNARCPALERTLADRVVASGDFSAVAGLAAEHPLRHDGDFVRQARVAMIEGRWTDAVEALSGLPRESPYAPWRIFSKAMCFRENGDRENLLRALSYIPDGFLLSKTVTRLKGEALAEETPASGAGHPAEESVRRLIDLISRGSFTRLKQTVLELARSLGWEGSRAVVEAILEALVPAVSSDILPEGALQKAIRDLLPPARARVVLARTAMAGEIAAHAWWNLRPAEKYLSLLPQEFPNDRDRVLARSIVLKQLALDGAKGDACPGCLPRETMEALARLSGGESDDGFLVDLVGAAVEIDPYDREAYGLLLQLLARRGSSRQRIGALLEKMVEQFPEDPAPCLELASFYYRTNAYRKAEKVLCRALERAPHDERVQDRYALGMIRSADGTRARGRLEEARSEYAKAAEMNSPRLGPLIEARFWALDLLTGKAKHEKALQKEITTLAPVNRLRLLVFLMMDAGNLKNAAAARRVQRVAAHLLDQQSEYVVQLSSRESASLFEPLPREFRDLFPMAGAASLLRPLWSGLLRRTDGDDLFSALCAILASTGSDSAVRHELSRRLAASPPDKRDARLDFMRIFLDLRGMPGASLAPFRDLLERAGEDQNAALRRLAERLAELAHGVLGQALRMFDFRDHQAMPLPPPLDFDEALDGDEDEWDDDFSRDGEVDALIEEMERFVDKSGLRGAPIGHLKDMRGIMRSSPESRRVHDLIAISLEPFADELSPEARLLLFGTRR
ncbi:MAG: tetratricopeptide repeat protein [Acidobacteriota bacterium]